MNNLNDVNLESPSYTLITDAKLLPALVSQWQDASFLAIDTEFIRTHTFFAEPGLIQIADSHGVYLLDPVALKDLSPLIAVLENPNIVKIMHSMSEDVGLLFHSVGAQINRVFDTQIAAAFLGIGVSPGYQNLVLDVLNVELDKGETRSDWLQRPLTQRQLHYAALDVIYLLKLYQELKPKLEEIDYLNALFEESGFLIEQVFSAWSQPETAYLKLRSAWDLPESSQSLLQALVVWRDETALKENIPKPWVFNDASLIEIARLKPTNVIELKRIKSLQSKSYRQFSERLITCVNSFEYEKKADFQRVDAPVKGDDLVMYRKLKAVIASVSEETEIPAQLLGSRKMLESLVIHCHRNNNQDLTIEFKGWRASLLGLKFSEILFCDN
ncbi:MAG: ribonuclease D [Oleiphilaceae bacterium]|jgi:ribonuclease D